MEIKNYFANSMSPVWHLRRLSQLRYALLEMIRREWNSPLGKQLSLRDRLDCWKHGFFGESRLLYDFDSNPMKDYLTDYTRYTKGRINGVYTALLSNKVMFDAMMRPYQPNIPKTYAVVVNRKFQILAQHPRMHSWQDVIRWCLSGNDIVLKPYDGGGGSGIIVITAVEGELFLNGKCTSTAELEFTLVKLNRYLIQEKIEQADYARKIYQRTTNTIRVLTMWDSDIDEPFIASAVHRFGSAKSYPVDNWTQGGFCAAIDPATGEMSKAVTYPATGRLEWNDDHPDTGERIAGTRIPNWPAIRSNLLDIARTFPFLRYVGWDIVLDHNGTLKIIEGNHRSDVNLLQVHTPLLRDPRVRKFYQQT